MSQVINVQSAVTFTPSAFVSGSYSGTMSNSGNFVDHSHTNTASYATYTARTGTSAETYTFWSFDCSSIPNDATITSVKCSARCYVSSTSYVRTRSVQLYKGTTTAKGSSASFSNTTSVISFDGGSWTRSDLNTCNIRIYGKRGSNNTGSTATFRIYGATLEVNYTISGTQYEITSTIANENVHSIDPAGLTNVMSGGNYTLSIYADSVEDFKLTDNGVDVTSQLVQQQNSTSGTFSGVPVSYDSTNSSVSGTDSSNPPSNGYTEASSSTRAGFTSFTAANSQTYVYYGFDCSSIPENATINSVTCEFLATMSTAYFQTRIGQLCYGTTPKGSPTTVINTSTQSAKTIQTIDGGSWTRSELNNIKILVKGVRGSSTNAFTISFYGATLKIDYTVPSTGYHWTYTLTGVNADHTIMVEESVIIPPDEDPQYNYYPITISSINALTDPPRGTTRVVEGTSQTITITPTDPLLTLVTDNGVDITNQLVTHSGDSGTYTVTKANGATYGFTLSGNYYVSENKGVDKSAAVCRVDFDLPVSSLVTFKFINYAEASADYGVFGNVDETLSNNYYPYNSNQSMAPCTDSSYKLACNTNTYNSSSEQTLTYEIPGGQHYIYIKFSKDDASASYNDTLQFKIEGIQPLEANNYYTYTLSNIQQSHSLIFIFGDVTFYYVNTTGPDNARLYPDGSMVVLPGEGYTVTIVPNNTGDTFTATDNNVDVTSSLVREEFEVTKQGQTVTVVNITYTLTNIQATHNIVITAAGGSGGVYVKISGSWIQVTKVYLKENGSWTEQSDPEDLFDSETVYVKR